MKHKIMMIFLLLLLLILLTVKKYESFDDTEFTHLKSGVPQTPDILLDPLFEDMIFYQNDDEPYSVPNGKIGLDKCFDECTGTCVEFGVSGNAFCFPPLDQKLIDNQQINQARLDQQSNLEKQ
jgi:hypothetical protein